MKYIRFIFCAFLLPLLACTSGGGGDNSNDSGGVGTNACGTLGLNTRIINGTECDSTNSPVVEINLFTSDGNGALCSGTMVTSTDVLTAAHCFFSSPVTAFIKVNGGRVNAVSYVLHPGVSVSEQTGSVINDVAILKLDTAVNLPTVPLVESVGVQKGDLIQIFGYGQTENQSDHNETSGVLRSGEMRVSDVTTNHIFASFDGDGSNTCFGDSGGPALLTLSSGAVGIVGITSSGQSLTCSSGDVSLFTNLQGTSVLEFVTQAVPGIGVI